MPETTAGRLLSLLSLLQTAPEWTGEQLAERMDVTTRTIRRDVDRLRELGYPIESTSGVAGGYRLGPGGRMPPLLLDEEEALAVAVGLRTAAQGSVAGIEESSVRALTKLHQVLPPRLRQRVEALTLATATIHREGPTVDHETIALIAGACRANERLRFDYVRLDGTEARRVVEPHRLVSVGRRWYLVAWDVDRDDWRTFRVDRLTPRPPTGPRFEPRDPPDGDVATYLNRRMGLEMWPIEARLLMHAPAETFAGMDFGLVTPIDDDTCEVRIASDSLTMLAVWSGLADVDFTVLDPPELRERLGHLAARYQRAANS
ncbi:YafY family transcriptional regulator [Spiractinospora alimapuensis]|uniref:helix-turn-helix transcriptional regulator n=1 Tax=Spiractinospora alimapuensis TaxID=2820884 RepID=UPI001F24DB93|nr:YafY family protein [Spiractinospora alimapuensis]QVQ50311.1 YafY family transcriptional regulator [Spiractinospora alimapuensis]